MIITTLALTHVFQSELDHRTALAIWNRARNAHGFNTVKQNSVMWFHESPSLRQSFYMLDYNSFYEFTTQRGQVETYRFHTEGWEGTNSYNSYLLRTEFLKSPVGILTSPPQTITKSLSPYAFSLTVKGITIDVYLDPKTDRIDYIEFLDPTPGVRKFSKYAGYYDYIRPATLWLPESWQSGPDLKHLEEPFNVIYGLNECRGFSPWVPTDFDYKTPDLGVSGFSQVLAISVQ